MNKSYTNVSNLFLTVTGIAFLLLFVILSFHNRLASDDVYFLAMLKKQGFWDCYKNLYNGWSGRWTRTAYFFFVINLTGNYMHIHYVLFAYHMLTLLLLIIAMQGIIRFIFLKCLNQPLAKKDSFLYAVLFIACFYFFTVDIIETWWWICSTFSYLQGMCFLLVGAALILQQKHTLFTHCCISLCFIYTGGCMEIYSLIILGLFFMIVCYGLKTGRWKLWQQSSYFNAIAIAIISLLLSTIICVIAPGNYHRRISEIQVASDHVDVFPNLFTNLGNYFFQKKNGVALLLSALWLLLGMKLGETNKLLISREQTKKILLICLIPLVISLVIPYMFKILILDNVAVPARSWALTSFFIAGWMCLFFFLSGYHFFYSLKSISVLKQLIPFCSTVAMFAYVYHQYDLSSKYAKQHDELINTLLVAKERSAKTVFVKALPDPGMLLQLYIDDPYIDWTLKDVLGVKFEIIVGK